MKSKRSLSSSRRPITTRKLSNLTKKALNDGPEWGPSKGYKYLKDIPLGSKFKTGRVEGILLDVNKSAAKVLITDTKFRNEDDKKYYIGKQTIAPNTEVKVLWELINVQLVDTDSEDPIHH